MGAQVFLQLRLALAFPFPLHKCQAGKGAAAPSVAAWRPLVADHWFPACHLLSRSSLLLPLLQVGDVHKRILKFMKQQQPQQRWQQLQRAASESAATKRTF